MRISDLCVQSALVLFLVGLFSCRTAESGYLSSATEVLAESADKALKPAIPIMGNELDCFEPKPEWVAGQAASTSKTVTEGSLRLDFRQPGAMKWFCDSFPFFADDRGFLVIEYSATDVEAGDYLVWLRLDQGRDVSIPGNFVADGQRHRVAIHVKSFLGEGYISGLALSLQGAAGGEFRLHGLTYQRKATSASVVLPEDIPEEKKRGQSVRELVSETGGDARGDPLTLQYDISRSALQAHIGWNDWFPAEEVKIGGVRFRSSSLPNGAAIEVQRFSLETDTPYKKLCLLMALRLNSPDFFDPLKIKKKESLKYFEEFHLRTKYRDGQESTLPYPVGSDATTREVRDGLGVYCFSLRESAPVAIQGHFPLRNSALFILAATGLTDSASLSVPASTPMETALDIPYGKETSESGKCGDLRVDVESTNEQLILSGSSSQGSLFRSPFIGVVGESVNSVERISDTENSDSERSELDISTYLLRHSQGDIRVKIRHEDLCTIAVDIALTENQLQLSAPHLGHLTISQDDWYVFPARGTYLSNRDISIEVPVSNLFPMQFMGLFSPEKDVAMTVISTDFLGDSPTGGKTFFLNKRDSTSMAVRYNAPRQVSFVVRMEKGGFADILRTYKNRYGNSSVGNSSNHPNGVRGQIPKTWFQDIYNYRTHFIHGGDLFDTESNSLTFPKAVAKDRDFFGVVDYLHVFDFGKSKVFGRVCDYDDFSAIGGGEKLRAAIKSAQDLDVAVGLYFEGYICNTNSRWGRDRWSDHVIRDQQQSPVLYQLLSHAPLMCAHQAPWQDHLISRIQQNALDLQPDGIYIDQFGYFGVERKCYAENHNHPPGVTQTFGELHFLKELRQRFPQKALHGEFLPVDVNHHWQDGSLSYSIAYADRKRATTGVDLYRFMFPSFKVVQITSYNAMVEGSWRALKKVFFNAEGLYTLTEASRENFSEDAQDFLRKMFRLFAEHKTIFRSEDARPLVGTSVPGVYVNEFRQGEKTIWLVLNSTDNPISRLAIDSTRFKAGGVDDLWHDRPLGFDGDEGKVSIEPQGVGAFIYRGPPADALQ